MAVTLIVCNEDLREEKKAAKLLIFFLAFSRQIRQFWIIWDKLFYKKFQIGRVRTCFNIKIKNIKCPEQIKGQIIRR